MIAISALGNAFEMRAEGTVVTTDPNIFAAAKAAFADQEICFFRKVVEPRLLASIMEATRQIEFEPQYVGDYGERRMEVGDNLGAAIRDIIGTPVLMAWLEQVAGCDPLVRVTGRVIRTYAGTGQGLTWHNDLDHSSAYRRLAFVIHLTEVDYEGGEFEMTRIEEPFNHFNFAYRELGSMLVFRVAPHLTHRVFPITSGGPRQVFAGWLEAATRQPLPESYGPPPAD